MFHQIGRLACAATLTTACVLSTAHASTVIDFEPAALLGLYLPGDSFVQGEYTLSTMTDYGIVDTAAALGGSSPTGNATQFYFNSNDGALSVVRGDSGLFNLEGFAAAFVPLDPASLQTTVIVAKGTKADTSTVTVWWSFASSNTSHFPFSSYAGAGFGALSSLQKVDFYACSLVGNAVCTVATQNNGQFAIDNIVLSAVPESTPALMLTLGLIGLGLRARRAAR
jgi:hypothetical protein